MLEHGDSVLYAPDLTFSHELEIMHRDMQSLNRFDSVPPKTTGSPLSSSLALQTNLTDLDELALALENSGVPQDTMSEIIDAYSCLRSTLEGYSCILADSALFYNPSTDPESGWQEIFGGIRADNWTDYQKSGMTRSPYHSLAGLEIPDSLPLEFDLYIRGAVYYYLGDWCLARENWEQLLDLPVSDRMYRSTWASFMIAKTLMESDPVRSRGYFRLTRSLASLGFSDSLGLAASSYFWESRLNLRNQQYGLAFENAFLHYLSGDPAASGGLKSMSRDLLRCAPVGLDDAASNPIARKIISLYIASFCTVYEYSSYWNSYELAPRYATAWLDAVERAGVAGNIESADTLAWASYRIGRIDLAQKWFDRSDETGLALWLRAKLSMRDGDLLLAADCLERASATYSDSELWTDGVCYLIGKDYQEAIDEEWFFYDARQYVTVPSLDILAELGVVRLRLEDYPGALDAFLRAGYVLETSYVAEQVLTPDELKSYVDANWPDPGPGFVFPMGYWEVEGFVAHGQEQRAVTIRYYLAKRLARIGRWREAVEYYPENYRPLFEKYIRDIRTGSDTSLPDSTRADAYWDAALIARHQGMELLGAQLNPDWSILGGDTDFPGLYGVRTDLRIRWILHSRPGERDRLNQNIHEVDPYLRFHYRYIAASHAWSAAELMPSGSQDLAYRLCVAGTWLKNRDPQAADVFYKALVNRCRSTDLGRIADTRRWFPDCDCPLDPSS